MVGEREWSRAGADAAVVTAQARARANPRPYGRISVGRKEVAVVILTMYVYCSGKSSGTATPLKTVLSNSMSHVTLPLSEGATCQELLSKLSSHQRKINCDGIDNEYSN